MAIVKKVSSTGSSGSSTLGGNVRLEEANNRLVAFNGSNNLAIFGFDDAGNVAVKVAKPGFDANSASDDELIFNSAQNVFKIVDEGDTTVSSDGSPTNWNTVPLPPGLGFTPIVQAFLNNVTVSGITSSGNISLPTWGSLSVDTTNNRIDMRVFLTTVVDATNIYFMMFNSTGSPVSALPIHYYLLQETSN